MKRGYCIALDTHCQFCEMAVVDRGGEVCERQRCATTIPALSAAIDAVARPRRLVIEEGPLADWLWRNLRRLVDELIVSEPRRNRLIAQDGDKDDPVDAAKLAHLLWGGYVKAVHHPEDLGRSLFKQLVVLYHDRVRQRVAEGLRLASLFRRYGVMIRAKDFATAEQRRELLARLPDDAGLRAAVQSLWQGYDLAGKQEVQLHCQVVARAKQVEVIRRLEDLPGVGWIRAATWYAYLDTPWRFGSKARLWKYLGIGLERRRSGAGQEQLRVPRRVNRLLKCMILGAARSAIRQGANAFADQHRRWLKCGLTERLARRNVARSLAATMWGLWKNGSVYQPAWVGVAAAASAATPPSGRATRA